MATAQFVQQGNSIDHTPAGAITAGDVVVQGDLIGIAKVDCIADQIGALAVVGVFDIAKATGVGTGIAVGTKIYWDVADQEAKADDEAGANKYLGKTIVAAGDDDTTVRVRLEQ